VVTAQDAEPKLALVKPHSAYSSEQPALHPQRAVSADKRTVPTQKLPKPEDPFIARLNKIENSREAGPDSAFRSPLSKRSGQRKSSTAHNRLQDIVHDAKNNRAEITPTRDLVHYVTFAGETLSMIARWYTLDRANAGRLARINNMRDPNNLSLGDVIIVPSYLLRNEKRLSKQALDKLILLAQFELRQ